MKERTIFLLLLLILVVHLLFRVFQYSVEYLTPHDPSYWTMRYQESQWFVFRSQRLIGDDGLYTYQGWEYIHGADPSLLNPEVPFLGKYLIGISSLLFHNQNIFALLSGVFALCAMFLFNRKVIGNSVFALSSVLLFSFEPLFYTQLRAPFLDLLYLSFLFLTLYFVLRKKYFLSSVFLGCMISTKATYSTFILVVGAIVLFLLLSKMKKDMIKYIASLPLATIVYLCTYFQFFLLGHSFIDFLKVQKYIISFYALGPAKGNILSIWQVMLTGQWYTWWGEELRVSEWQVTWLILLLSSIVFATLYLLKKERKPGITLTITWFVVVFAFLHYVPLYPRYLLLLLPFMYNLTIWSLPLLKGIRLR